MAEKAAEKEWLLAQIQRYKVINSRQTCCSFENVDHFLCLTVRSTYLPGWMLLHTSAPVFEIKLNIFSNTLIQKKYFFDDENK